MRDRARQQLPPPAVPTSARCPATARRRSATSGAQRSAGRWGVGPGRGDRDPARPRGGLPRSSWGGPPGASPRLGPKNRFHLDLAVPADEGWSPRPERLLALGASPHRPSGRATSRGPRGAGRPGRQRALPTAALTRRLAPVGAGRSTTRREGSSSRKTRTSAGGPSERGEGLACHPSNVPDDVDIEVGRAGARSERQRAGGEGLLPLGGVRRARGEDLQDRLAAERD